MTYEEYMLFKKKIREVEEEIKQGVAETEEMIGLLFSSLFCNLFGISVEESVKEDKNKSEESKSKEVSKEHHECTCNSKCNNCGKKKEPKKENTEEEKEILSKESKEILMSEVLSSLGLDLSGCPINGCLNDEVVEFDDFEDLDLEERYEINNGLKIGKSLEEELSEEEKQLENKYNMVVNFQRGLTNGLSSMELIKVINNGLIKDGDTIFCRFEYDNKDIDNQLQRYIFDNGTIFEEISSEEEVSYEEIGISMLLDGKTPLRWIYISK